MSINWNSEIETWEKAHFIEGETGKKDGLERRNKKKKIMNILDCGILGANAHDIVDGAMLLDDLPDEVIYQMLKHLDCHDLAVVSQLSHAWQHRASDNQLYKGLVAKYYDIPVDNLHSAVADMEEDWKAVLRDIFVNIVYNDRYSWPTRLANFAERKLSAELKFIDDMSCTFIGSIGGNQSVFADAPYRPLVQNNSEVKPFILLEAFYEKRNDSVHSSNTSVRKVNTAAETSKKPKVHYRLVRRYIAYYEITIKPNPQEHKEERRDPCIAIGLANKMFPAIGYQPGWLRNSYGYHSDDGKKFCLGSQNYGPKFGPGDTIGLGLNFKEQSIFFTVNGKALDIAFDNVFQTELFPVVGLDSNDIITFNFGELPFAYDFTNIPQSSRDTKDLPMPRWRFFLRDPTEITDETEQANDEHPNLPRALNIYLQQLQQLLGTPPVEEDYITSDESDSDVDFPVEEHAADDEEDFADDVAASSDSDN